MAKRAPGYRPYRKFAVKSLATKGMTDNSTPSVLVNALILHECLVRHFVGHVGQVGLYWCAAGTKKGAVAKPNVLRQPLFYAIF